jgi:hypothetical protein
MISQQTRDRWDKKIAFLLEHVEDGGLTSWEIDFVDSVSIRREYGKDLSMQQAITLNRIYRKAEERVG